MSSITRGRNELSLAEPVDFSDKSRTVCLSQTEEMLEDEAEAARLHLIRQIEFAPTILSSK